MPSSLPLEPQLSQNVRPSPPQLSQADLPSPLHWEQNNRPRPLHDAQSSVMAPAPSQRLHLLTIALFPADGPQAIASAISITGASNEILHFFRIQLGNERI